MSSKDLVPSQEMHLSEREFQALPREQQEEYLSLLEKEIGYRKSKKILYYLPYPKQEQFHSSSAICRAIFGGNRSGKTTAGGMEFLFHITGMYPKWYPEAKRLKGPCIGRIIGKDFQKGIGEVIIPFLESWLDNNIVQKKYRNPIGIPVKWTLKNGSVFDILTHEQNTEQFEGWKGHIAWFDEPPPRDKYIATLRGLVDYQGRHWLTLTPLTQPWIYDDIYVKADNKRIFCIITDIRDNPHLAPEAIIEFEKALTEEEKEARIHGKFLHLTGLVYKEFNADIHICPPVFVKKHWTRYFAIDPHERTPTACLWFAVDDQDNHWVYDELWLPDMSIEQISHAIHAQEGDLKPHVRLIDPHMDKENELAGKFNIRKELMKHGIYCQRGSSDPYLGKQRIKHALKPFYSHLKGTEIAQLHISSDCRNVINEFQHYIWDNYKRSDEYNLKERAKKKDDHFMDCLRYIYNYQPRYVVPEEEEAEVEYAGEYTKYPTKRSTGVSRSYRDLVERKPGEF